jgi:hypothetical protein
MKKMLKDAPQCLAVVESCSDEAEKEIHLDRIIKMDKWAAWISCGIAIALCYLIYDRAYEAFALVNGAYLLATFVRDCVRYRKYIESPLSAFKYRVVTLLVCIVPVVVLDWILKMLGRESLIPSLIFQNRDVIALIAGAFTLNWWYNKRK